jgi:flavoprotein
MAAKKKPVVKKTPCHHKERGLFLFRGDPDPNNAEFYYNCYMEQSCLACGKSITRLATSDEKRAEFERLRCEVCGLRRDDHPTDGTHTCIKLLVHMHHQLQKRVEELEAWQERIRTG